jgi:hypothetical protein
MPMSVRVSSIYLGMSMLAVVWNPLLGMKSHILSRPSAPNSVGIISCILLFQETVRKISFSCRNALFGRQSASDGL